MNRLEQIEARRDAERDRLIAERDRWREAARRLKAACREHRCMTEHWQRRVERVKAERDAARGMAEKAEAERDAARAGARELEHRLSHQREVARLAIAAFEQQTKERQVEQQHWEEDRDRWRFAAQRLKAVFKAERDRYRIALAYIDESLGRGRSTAALEHNGSREADAALRARAAFAGKGEG